MTRSILMTVGLILASCGFAQQQEIVVRQAPYVVSSVSTKTERGETTCRYCSTQIR